MSGGPRHGGRILVDQLRVQGVDRVFSVPGESFLAALDGLHGSGIANVVCRHEGGAAMMAEADGKLTGRPGVVFVTRGPGACNASAGLHVAMQDSTPHGVLRGAGRARPPRPGRVPGGRLPRDVRRPRQVGGGGGRHRAAAGIRRARLLDGDVRAAGAGRARAARGHAFGAGGGARPARRGAAARGGARPRTDDRAAAAGPASDRRRGRVALVRPRRARPRRLGRAARAARRGRVPAAGPRRQPIAVLRGRPQRRAEPQADGAAGGGRPARRARHAAGRRRDRRIRGARSGPRRAPR